MNLVFLALPLVAQGLNITQRCEPSKQLGIRRAPIWPSTCKFDTVQLKVPSPSKFSPEQLFQLFHPRRVSKLLRNWNVLCTPIENLSAGSPHSRSKSSSNVKNLPMSHKINVHPALPAAVRGGCCMSKKVNFPQL